MQCVWWLRRGVLREWSGLLLMDDGISVQVWRDVWRCVCPWRGLERNGVCGECAFVFVRKVEGASLHGTAEA